MKNSGEWHQMKEWKDEGIDGRIDGLNCLLTRQTMWFIGGGAKCKWMSTILLQSHRVPYWYHDVVYLAYCHSILMKSSIIEYLLCHRQIDGHGSFSI